MNAKHEPGAAERDDLVDSAWDLVTQALETGQFTLKSGQGVTLTSDQLVKHMQWVAGLGKRKPKATPALKDYFLAKTRDVRKSEQDVKEKV